MGFWSDNQSRGWIRIGVICLFGQRLLVPSMFTAILGHAQLEWTTSGTCLLQKRLLMRRRKRTPAAANN